MNKAKLEEIVKNIINEETFKNEYRYYGVRAHHNKDSVVGEYVENSFDWITETELDGACAIDVVGVCQEFIDDGNENVTEIVNDIFDSVNGYVYDDGEIIMIGADSVEYGEDDNEIVMDGIRIA